MMNVLIIEDEKLAAERLEKILKEVDPSMKVLDTIGSVKESIQWLKNNKADLIFLDIQLSDGVSFNIFDYVTVSTPVIFTTAYDQYAIKAFNLNSVAYLLKPIRKTDLKESLLKYNTMKSVFGIDFEHMMATYQGRKPEYKKRFLIRIGDKYKKVETEEIAYFYALEKSIFCKTFHGKTLNIDYSLDALEEMMNPEQFFRINRKYIVHIEAIENMVAWGRGRIKLDLNPMLDDDMEVVVSIDRSADFRNWLNA
jgi:DNA-binding LytR/AlgR family response regulator